MKKKVTIHFISAVVICFTIIACNQQAKTDETTTTDTTKAEVVSMPGFDPAMDATKVPGYPASILADSLNLKAYEFLANPGDSIPLHAHPDHVLYVVEGGTAEIKGKDGAAQIVEFKKGTCMIFGPETHSAKNTGVTAIKLLIVHVYRPRS